MDIVFNALVAYTWSKPKKYPIYDHQNYLTPLAEIYFKALSPLFKRHRMRGFYRVRKEVWGL